MKSKDGMLNAFERKCGDAWAIEHLSNIVTWDANWSRIWMFVVVEDGRWKNVPKWRGKNGSLHESDCDVRTAVFATPSYPFPLRLAKQVMRFRLIAACKFRMRKKHYIFCIAICRNSLHTPLGACMYWKRWVMNCIMNLHYVSTNNLTAIVFLFCLFFGFFMDNIEANFAQNNPFWVACWTRFSDLCRSCVSNCARLKCKNEVS